MEVTWEPWSTNNVGTSYSMFTINDMKGGIAHIDEGYVFWFEHGHRTKPYLSIEDAIQAGKAMMKRSLKRRIDGMQALLDTIQELPSPPGEVITELNQKYSEK